MRTYSNSKYENPEQKKPCLEMQINSTVLRLAAKRWMK